MRFLKNNWPSTEYATRYKLFAELVLELVDENSWESYKCHSLSSRVKLAEVALACDQVISRIITKPTLTPIIEEINEAIFNDPIFKKIIKSKQLEDIELKLDPTLSTEKNLSRAELLIGFIEGVYKDECESFIIDSCAKGGSKYELISVIKLYISHIVNIGYSEKFIYNVALEHFSNDDIKRCGKGLLVSFFKNFSIKNKREFDVLFSGNRNNSKIIFPLADFPKFDSWKDLGKDIRSGIPERFGEGYRKTISLMPGISANDPYSAAEKAKSILSLLMSFQNIHPINVDGRFDKAFYVVDKKTNRATYIDKSDFFRPLKYLRQRKSGSEAAASLASYVFNTSRRDRSRQERLIRSLNSIALASTSSDSESRLITIWSAFEALLPEPSRDEGKNVRITHFVPLIVPCACFDYIYNTFSECYEDCSRQIGKPFLDALENEQEFKGVKALAAVMLGSEERKKALTATLRNSPLMLNRLQKLHDLANDPRRLFKFWEQHEKRVGWQIFRIYRERNSIVHKGASSKFIDGLVDNSFNYYRSVFLGLEGVAKKYDVLDPTGGLELISELYKKRKESMYSIITSNKLDRMEKNWRASEVIFDNTLI